MDIALFGLWLVCGLGTAVFAALALTSRAMAAAAVVLFVAGAWWIRQPFAPAPAAIETVVASVAGLWLVRSRPPRYAPAFAALLGGLWTGVLAAQGIPSAATVTVAAAVPAISASLRARRAAFAPAPLREEALLFILVLGLTAAAVPAIADGWHAAANLNLPGREAGAAATVAIPAWTLTVAITALVSGGLFSLWSRR